MIDVEFKRDGESYVCSFNGCGWSYAECRVYKRVKLLGFIPWLSYCYDSTSGFGWGPALIDQVNKASPDRLVKWANNVFEEYWRYKTAWKGYKK